jgi:hypothetical protein
MDAVLMGQAEVISNRNATRLWDMLGVISGAVESGRDDGFLQWVQVAGSRAIATLW